MGVQPLQRSFRFFDRARKIHNMDSHYTALPAIVKLFVVNMVTAIVLTIGIKNTCYAKNHHSGIYDRPNGTVRYGNRFQDFPFRQPSEIV